MAHPQHAPSLSHLEEVVTVLFCLIDDAYRLLDPMFDAASLSKGPRTRR